MTRIAILLAALLSSPAQAGEVDEATKITALKLGYALNGNSMVRWGSIDLTIPDLAARAKGDRETLPKQKERFKGR